MAKQSTKATKHRKPTQAGRRPAADFLKWASVFFLLLIVTFANVRYANVQAPVRLIAGFVVACLMLFLVLSTTLGKQFVSFFREARNELRRVVWPTRQQTIQIALIVAVMVLLVAVAIFLLDQLFLWLISLIAR